MTQIYIKIKMMCREKPMPPKRLQPLLQTDPAGIDTKTRPIYIYCLQETHFRPQDTYRLKVRGWKNIFRANGKRKKAGVAILISEKIDLKIKKTARNKKGHYIMIKGSI